MIIVIASKKELKQVLREEFNFYFKKRVYIIEKITMSPFYMTWKYQKNLRKEEYYFNRKFKIRFLLTRRKKNKIGNKLGFYISKNVIDSGLKIYHTGNIVINEHSVIGKNLKLHGDNCIGNDGKNIGVAPIIGDNVELGFGASIVGNVKIVDNVIIGAGAVVVTSCLESNVTLVGVPAKILRK